MPCFIPELWSSKRRKINYTRIGHRAILRIRIRTRESNYFSISRRRYAKISSETESRPENMSANVTFIRGQRERTRIESMFGDYFAEIKYVF